MHLVVRFDALGVSKIISSREDAAKCTGNKRMDLDNVVLEQVSMPIMVIELQSDCQYIWSLFWSYLNSKCNCSKFVRSSLLLTFTTHHLCQSSSSHITRSSGSVWHQGQSWVFGPSRPTCNDAACGVSDSLRYLKQFQQHPWLYCHGKKHYTGHHLCLKPTSPLVLEANITTDLLELGCQNRRVSVQIIADIHSSLHHPFAQHHSHFYLFLQSVKAKQERRVLIYQWRNQKKNKIMSHQSNVWWENINQHR